MADRKSSNNRYYDEAFLNRNDLPDISAFINITQAGLNNYTRNLKQTQEDFVEYFNAPKGSVPWQYRMVIRTRND